MFVSDTAVRRDSFAINVKFLTLTRRLGFPKMIDSRTWRSPTHIDRNLIPSDSTVSGEIGRSVSNSCFWTVSNRILMFLLLFVVILPRQRK